MKNSKLIAIKQAVAFCIDLALVSLPLIIAPSVEIFLLFALLWFSYIPLSEYYFSQTFGMKIVGTHIYASHKEKNRISLGIAARRHIARVGFLWGVVGWFLMFLGKPYHTDYVISDDKNYSVDTDEQGFVEVHHNNQYKVILLFFVVIAFFDVVMGFFK